jgi:hypothetical protein
LISKIFACGVILKCSKISENNYKIPLISKISG